MALQAMSILVRMLDNHTQKLATMVSECDADSLFEQLETTEEDSITTEVKSAYFSKKDESGKVTSVQKEFEKKVILNQLHVIGDLLTLAISVEEAMGTFASRHESDVKLSLQPKAMVLEMRILPGIIIEYDSTPKGESAPGGYYISLTRVTMHRLPLPSAIPIQL